MTPFFVFEKCVGGPEKIPEGCESEKFENVLGAPENKNREKRVWAIAQNYLHSITFKVQCPRFLSRRQAQKKAPKRLSPPTGVQPLTWSPVHQVQHHIHQASHCYHVVRQVLPLVF